MTIKQFCPRSANQNRLWEHDLRKLHVRFTVGAFVVFEVAVLGDELVGFLPLLLLQHRVSHLHVLAAELVSGQELHDAGADRVSQNIGGGAQTVPGKKSEITRRTHTVGGAYGGIRGHTGARCELGAA